ncbi:MAG: ATP-binding protein [Bacteroides sp.]|nr:ATP-binding protein [Bacteroides sp.]
MYIILALGMLSVSLKGNPGTDSLMAQLDTSQVSRKQAELRLQIAGEIYNDDVETALALSREALRQAELLGAKSLVAEAKLSIGMSYDYLGVKEEAIGYLEEAMEVFTQLGMPDKEASALKLIGNAYYYLNQFDTALKYYTKALAIGYALNDTTLIISGINAKGAVYGNTGPKDSALILFREANELAKQINDQKLVIHTYYNIGDLNLYSGRIDDALGIFHELENKYDVEKYSSMHLGNLYNSITLAHILKGDLKWAKRYSDTCRIALDRYGRLTENRQYYLNLYRIDSIEGNYQSALINFSKYTSLSDSLNNAAFKERLAKLEIGFNLKAQEVEIERLTLDNRLKDLQIRQRKIINYSAIGGFILLLTILFLLFRSGYKTRERNVLLEEQKDELEMANVKIRSQSHDLLDKNSELESVIDELKATQQHLVQSEKMASLGTLTAGVAHEINNPLNFISGGLGIIHETDKEGNPMSVEEKECRRIKATKLAFDGLDRATEIVKALMTFSHRGASKKSLSDLHDIIDNTLLFLQSKLSDQIELRKEYRLTELVPVFQEKIHQVILNIIDNAIFATKKNGQGKRLITITTDVRGANVVLDISNNGPAIGEGELPQLFDPFFTTKDPGEGTGLGLSISYTLIDDHGGSIRAENREDGVHFVIELPA